MKITVGGAFGGAFRVKIDVFGIGLATKKVPLLTVF